MEGGVVLGAGTTGPRVCNAPSLFCSHPTKTPPTSCFLCRLPLKKKNSPPPKYVWLYHWGHLISGHACPPTRCSRSPPSRLPKGGERKGELSRNPKCQQSTGQVEEEEEEEATAAAAKESGDSYLHEAQRQEGPIVGTEEGVEEDLLDPAVEVCLQAFHLVADEVGGQGAAVGRDGQGAVELFSQGLSQEGEKVSGLDEAADPRDARLHQLVLHQIVTVRRKRLRSALLVEAAQWDVDAKPARDGGQA